MLFDDDNASIADDLPPMNTQSIYKRIQTYPQELTSWKKIYLFGHKLDCVQKPRFSISIIEILQVDVVHQDFLSLFYWLDSSNLQLS